MTSIVVNEWRKQLESHYNDSSHDNTTKVLQQVRRHLETVLISQINNSK